MKAFFSKIWLWALANKVIAIAAASVLVAGTACAIVLPIALGGDDPADTQPPVTEAPGTEADGETTIEPDEETTIEPEETTVEPEETTTAPEETTTAPEETTTAPEETTTAPEETTTAPEETTTAPEETTTAPEETTTAPEETTAPEKTTATITDVQDLSKTYDATAVANPTFNTDSDGTATIEWYKAGVKLDAAPKDAGDYVVKILIPETDEYKAATAEKAFTVTKRPIWAQNTEFVYDGSENFCGDEYPVAVLQNVVAGDTVELYDITWYFDSKNVGATLIEVDLTEEYNPNYEIDFSKCTASIVKRAIWVTDVEFTYDGSDNFYGDYAVSAITFQDVVTGEAINPCDIVFTFEDINVGSALTAVNYDDGITSNYEFDLSKCTASIVPKPLNYLEFTMEYNGEGLENQILGTEHGAVAGDELMLEMDWCIAYNAGTVYIDSYGNNDENLDSCFLYGADWENYQLFVDENGHAGKITVTPKPLNVLDIEFTYDGGNIPSRFDLTAADGVIAGDDVFLYGDGWQSYDVAYDEYTLTDDFGSYDYDEGVSLNGADKGNYKFTYDTDGSVGKITVLPYILDFTGEYVKDADGTHYFTFTQDVTWSQGGTDTVTVKIALVDPEGHWITAPGVYTQANAQICDESFHIGSYKCEGFELDDDYYADEFKVTVLSSDDLILQATDRFHIGTDYIIVVQVKQGTVKVGDSIVLPGTPDKVYEVLKIEKNRLQLEYATVGDEVGLYVDGMVEHTEVPVSAFLYKAGNIPEMASEFLAEAYLRTSAEGGRQTPAFDNYAPTFRGLGLSLTTRVNFISHYGKADDELWIPGETMLVKITLATPVPAVLLEGLEFSMVENSKTTITGTVVQSFIESAPSGNTMLKTDEFNTEALTPIVLKITNSRTEAMDTLELFASNGSGGGSYLTDYTIELYDEDLNQIEGTHNNTAGTFTKTDSSTWSLAAGDTCYVVLKTTNATNGVFVRLM